MNNIRPTPRKTGPARARAARPGAIKRVALCALVLALQACAFAPGSHLSTSGSADEPDSSEQELPDVVRVHELGPSMLEASQRSTAMSVSDDLQHSAEDYDYVVGPGDVLNITVWDHPELTIPQGSERSAEEAGNWVHSDGTIFYPYVGKVEVAGLRVGEIRKLITRRLSEYIEEPQVEVTVAAFRSQKVYVTGAVNKPGTLPVTNVPMRLLDAVNAAGGVNEFANWRDVTLTRDGREYELSLRAINELGRPQHNVLLQPGDVVHVARNDDNKVFVLGEVMKPSPVVIKRGGMSLAGALAEAGGLDKLTADASGVFVMRRAPANVDQAIDLYQLDADRATALVMADQFRLQPRDIVYVTAAPISRWNRVIQNILPTVRTLYFGALTEDRLREIDE